MGTKHNFWDGHANDGALDPAAYHDPSAEVMQTTGRSLLASMPPPIWGARGVIVRHSTEGGAPIGYDPNTVAPKVFVDPELPGEGFVVDMSTIKKDAMAQAVEGSGVTRSRSIEDRRFAAADALRQFSVPGDLKEAAGVPSAPAPREAPVALPGLYVVPDSTVGGSQVSEPKPTVMTKQAAKPAAPVPRPVAAASIRPATLPQIPQPVQQQPASLFSRMGNNSKSVDSAPGTNGSFCGPPTIKLTFEVENSPFPQEAYYHCVDRNDDTLLLAFDRRAVGYPVIFPRNTGAVLAVELPGTNAIYLTRVLVERRPFLDWDICILQITAEHPA
jgi:hypothetical protein